MKKGKYCFLMPVMVLVITTACSRPELKNHESKINFSAEEESTQIDTTAVTEPAAGSLHDATESSYENDDIDLDLTQLSSTMVYSEVYNMIINPDNYYGKVIKIKGEFIYYQDTNTGNQYYSCVIADATACCAQGLEFVLKGDKTYPEDYPEPNSEITIIGKFENYEEGGYEYLRLVNASLV